CGGRLTSPPAPSDLRNAGPTRRHQEWNVTRTAVDLHPHRGSGPIDPSPGEPPERLTVKPWWDSRLALVGVRPDDPYVERFWLAIVGPSTVVLIRRFTRGLDEHPEGFRVGLLETSLAMGLG